MSRRRNISFTAFSGTFYTVKCLKFSKKMNFFFKNRKMLKIFSKLNHKTPLESWELIKNYEPLKNCDFLNLGGVRGSPKTPYFAILGGFGGTLTPPKSKKSQFFNSSQFFIDSQLSSGLLWFNFEKILSILRFFDFFCWFFWKF